MNRALVFIFTLQAALLFCLPTRSKEYENFDQQCFDDAFIALPPKNLLDRVVFSIGAWAFDANSLLDRLRSYTYTYTRGWPVNGT